MQHSFSGLFLFCFMLFPSVIAQDSFSKNIDEANQAWTWLDGDGKRKTLGDLLKILDEHKSWVNSNGERGKKAYFGNSDLRRANFISMNLRGAVFVEANLAGASFMGADMAKAIFVSANLSNANLFDSKLDGAKFRWANLKNAQLNDAVLTRVDFFEADLRNANLSGSDFSHSSLVGADLRGAFLSRTGLEGSIKNIRSRFFKNFPLSISDDFWKTSDNYILYDGPRGANFNGADLACAKMSGTATDGVKLESSHNLELVEGLSDLLYVRNPSTLVRLRKYFRENGFREYERQITFAINSNKVSSGKAKIEVFLRKIFFEATCKWGMDPGGCLKWMFIVFLICVFPYFFAQFKSGNSRFGIWLRWDENRASTHIQSHGLERIQPDSIHKKILWAMYFSTLSAFHIGWRDLNVGSWISRIQPREFTLQANGWVRIVSGCQSLISVYLLALWVLTYFGRPFG